MPILNTLTDVIAGPRRVRESQERASARLFSGLDEKMRSIRDISPESRPIITNDLSSKVNLNTPSRDASLEPQVMSPLPRPDLLRSQSELPIRSPCLSPQPEFTPCITAMELSSDQIKRNYSHNDLPGWDRTTSPLPPLYPMMGVGRYRTSVTADPQWRTEHFRKQISGLDGLESMIAELDMSNVSGMSSDEWQEVTSSGARRASEISSNSTHTTSSIGFQDLGNDARLSTRISRGFSPSASSSARSSFNVHSQKGSTLSMIAAPAEAETSLLQKPLQRQSAAFTDERRNSVPLSTINELQPHVQKMVHLAKKIEKPCDFADGADPDSAVASDIDEDGEWVDDPELTRVSAITQMLKDGKRPESTMGLTRVRTTSSDRKHGKGSTISVDRSRTIRNNKTHSRRKKSKSQLGLHQHVKSEEKKFGKPAAALASTESLDDSTELYMHIPGGATKTSDKKFEFKDESTLVEEQTEHMFRTRRHRSNTALYDESKSQQRVNDVE